MEKTAIQAYYEDTRKSLMDNITALRSLVHQARALSDAIQQLSQTPDIDPNVVKQVEGALKSLFTSIDELTDKVSVLFDNYGKLSEQLFPDN